MAQTSRLSPRPLAVFGLALLGTPLAFASLAENKIDPRDPDYVLRQNAAEEAAARRGTTAPVPVPESFSNPRPSSESASAAPSNQFRVDPVFIREHARGEAGRIRFPETLNPIGKHSLPFSEARIQALAAAAAKDQWNDLRMEFFYPQLIAASSAYNLTPKLEKRILQYQKELGEQNHRLKKVILEAKALPPEERIARLQAFAQEQEPALASLENQAEDIRKAFDAEIQDKHSGLSNWITTRTWKYDDKLANQGAGTQRFVRGLLAQGYAYYLPELSTTQRELLIEFSIGERQISTTSSLTGKPISASYAFHPNRVLLARPGDLNPELDLELADLNDEKRAITKELFDVIVAIDVASSKEQRAKALAKLQELDQPHKARLAALIPKFDAVRLRLAKLPASEMIGGYPSILPPSLRAEALALYEQRSKEFSQAVRPGTKANLASSAEIARDPKAPAQENSMLMEVMGLGNDDRSQARQGARIEASRDPTSPNTHAALRELNEQVTNYFTEHPELLNGLSPSIAAIVATSGLGLSKRWNQNEDFYDAALLSGLSEAQRELLLRNTLLPQPASQASL